MQADQSQGSGGDPQEPQEPQESLCSLSKLSALIPVRCFTCGKVLANKWGRWVAAKKKLALSPGASTASKSSYGRVPEADILDSLGIRRICCRRMVLTHTEKIVCAPKKQTPVHEVRTDANVHALSTGQFQTPLNGFGTL